MDKTQATGIHKRLLAVGDAINAASSAIFELAKEDRRIFIEHLSDLGDCLHFEMLRLIYKQYPELRPPAEPPTISSELRWEDVTLPASVSEADLDAIIFSMLTSQWQKTAMVGGKAVAGCNERALTINDEMLAARLQTLAESNRIESVGDLRMWRHSEVKLKN